MHRRRTGRTLSSRSSGGFERVGWMRSRRSSKTLQRGETEWNPWRRQKRDVSAKERKRALQRDRENADSRYVGPVIDNILPITLSAQRWDRRVDICTTKKLLALEPFEKTRWREFLDIVKTLGKDGMSSDESTEEEGTHRKCYRISLLPWRRDFDAIMEAINAERFKGESGYSNRGSVPTLRYRQDRRLAHSKDAPASVRVSRRPPVTKLPAAFYDNHWTSMRSTEYVHGVLCGSDEGYEWVIRVAQAYSEQEAGGE